jgi:prolyl oligopeptidase PreP (S9A serine peptidase family)
MEGHDPADHIQISQAFVPALGSSKDIPMFIIHKKGAVPNGAYLTLLTGYGGMPCPISCCYYSL